MTKQKQETMHEQNEIINKKLETIKKCQINFGAEKGNWT